MKNPGNVRLNYAVAGLFRMQRESASVDITDKALKVFVDRLDDDGEKSFCCAEC